MRRYLPLLLLGAAGCLTARGTPDAPVISALELRGVRNVSRSDLVDKLATHASSCFITCDVAHLDRDELAEDRLRIAAFYKEQGRYQAVVLEPQVTADGAGRVKVRFVVNEGPLARVTRLVTPGLETAPQAVRAVGRPALKVGARFTVEAYDAMKAQLLAALRSTGWALAEVTPHAHVLPGLLQVEVTYTVVPGPRLKFGSIHVTGTVKVPPGKVVDRTTMEVVPGATFDERALAHAQVRVFNLGVFGGARVFTGPPDLERGELPVVVTVQEAPFQTLKAGPGIAFQSARWEAQALATWTNRNFFGDVRKLQIETRAGYAWIPTPVRATREGLVGAVTATMEQPGALAQRVDLALRLGAERSIEQSYAYWALRARVGTPLQLATRWILLPSYNIENYWLDAGYNPANGLVPPQLQSCNTSRLCMLSYLEQRILFDGRDDPIATRSGFMAGLTLQEGFRIGPYGYRYLRVSPEVSFYLPLGWKTVLAGRLRVGGLVPLSESGPASIVALFTSGGSNSIRGYGNQRLSPMAFQDGRWVPTGGNGVVEASLELRQQLGVSLGGVLFVDAGNVSGASGGSREWLRALTLADLQPSAGLGLRYKTPLGPVRLDVGVRIPTDFRAGIPFADRFPAVPGPPDGPRHREPMMAFHLSLGEAY